VLKKGKSTPYEESIKPPVSPTDSHVLRYANADTMGVFEEKGRNAAGLCNTAPKNGRETESVVQGVAGNVRKMKCKVEDVLV
jgi:hypothetical protein